MTVQLTLAILWLVPAVILLGMTVWGARELAVTREYVSANVASVLTFAAGFVACVLQSGVG